MHEGKIIFEDKNFKQKELMRQLSENLEVIRTAYQTIYPALVIISDALETFDPGQALTMANEVQSQCSKSFLLIDKMIQKTNELAGEKIATPKDGELKIANKFILQSADLEEEFSHKTLRQLAEENLEYIPMHFEDLLMKLKKDLPLAMAGEKESEQLAAIRNFQHHLLKIKMRLGIVWSRINSLESQLNGSDPSDKNSYENGLLVN